jgi:hypothetical protein
MTTFRRVVNLNGSNYTLSSGSSSISRKASITIPSDRLGTTVGTLAFT